MRFRLVNPYLRAYFKPVFFSLFTRIRFLILIGFILFIQSNAFAVVTMSLPASNTNGATAFVGNTVYYYVNYDGKSEFDLSKGFFPSNFTAVNISRNIEQSGVTLDNTFKLIFRSDKTYTLSLGQQAYVVVQIPQGSGGSSVFAPIAGVGGSLCNDGNCGNRKIPTGLNFNRYYAAKYPAPQSSIELDLDLNQICSDYKNVSSSGSIAQGCDPSTGTTLALPKSGAVTTFSLNFSLMIANSTDPTAAPTGTPQDTTSPSITMSFQVDTPKFGCPDQNTLNYSYIPADGKILLNQTNFRLDNITGTAPLKNIVVVGKDQSLTSTTAVPVVDSTFNSGTNTLVQSVEYKGSTGEAVEGFTNSTYPKEHLYNLSFLLQDAAGFYAFPTLGTASGANANGCLLSGVETVPIQAFLNKNSCFIATAAFQSAESAPVAMLREFRDRFLLRSSLGQSFVSWYYSWSPNAAEWLDSHPVFRLPVLIFLAPLEAFAWLCLNPFWLILYTGVSLVLGLTLLGIVLVRNSRSNG